MSDSIVRRLLERKNSIRFFEADDKPDINEKGIDLDIDDGESGESEDNENDDSVEDNLSGESHRSSKIHTSNSSPDIEDDNVGEEDDEDGDLLDTPPDEYKNPLDNLYAVKHCMGDEVRLSYSDGTASGLFGTVDGYDSEGFYRIKWNNGMTTNGITDIALADVIKGGVSEGKCVCGHKKFIVEDGSLICDHCGRLIERYTDQLTMLDKNRKKGHRLIRSEVHPISTAPKPNIDIGEAIKTSLKSLSKEIATEPKV